MHFKLLERRHAPGSTQMQRRSARGSRMRTQIFRSEMPPSVALACAGHSKTASWPRRARRKFIAQVRLRAFGIPMIPGGACPGPVGAPFPGAGHFPDGPIKESEPAVAGSAGLVFPVRLTPTRPERPRVQGDGRFRLVTRREP